MSRRGFETGLSAELAVTELYRARGATLLAERMRNEAGEIDLIFKHGVDIVFVEVTARKSLTAAAGALSPAQAGRIMTAAQIWLDQEGHGALHPCRVDVALVDRAGQVEIIENALMG